MPRNTAILGSGVSVGSSGRPANTLYSSRGFTLIELMVVLTIIAVMVALLLPALASAQMQAALMQCRNNEKQMVLAWTLYSGDNNDHLVANGGDRATTSTQAHLWVYGGNHGSPDTLTNTQYLVGGNYSLFGKIIPTERVYKCPADRTTWPVWGAKLSHVSEMRSYAMNSYVGTTDVIDPIQTNAGYKLYLKASQVVADAPFMRFVFTDVNPASICTPAFGVDMTRQTWIHLPSDLHQQRGALAFADGHVEAHRWTDARTRVRLTAQDVYIPHGNSSFNNPDLLWLTERTTSRK